MIRMPVTKQVNPKKLSLAIVENEIEMRSVLPRPKKLERIYPSEISDPPLPPDPPKPLPPRLIKEGKILQAFVPSMMEEELSKIPKHNPDRRNVDYSKTPPTQWMIWFIKHLRSKINREKSFEYKIVNCDYRHELHVFCKKWFITRWWFILEYPNNRKDQAEYAIKIFFEFKEQELIAAYESRNEKRFVIDHKKKQKQDGQLSVIDDIIENEQPSIEDANFHLRKIKEDQLELKERLIKKMREIKELE